jgi:uncharacterized protein YndB with AHSA1/START domain
MTELPYRLERTVVIKASPETVFQFFTDSERWAGWWGAGSTIEARPGGKVYIRHPNGVEVLGEVLEVRAPEWIVFTYGFASGTPMPPGSSKVAICLDPHEAGTRLSLTHEFAAAEARDQHVQGWRFQLSLFANLVANAVFADAGARVDAWFEAWTIPDEKLREDAFARIATPEIQFHDRYSLLNGYVDLTAHSGATLRFMPGLVTKRSGEVRHCQGVVLADWKTVNRDGNEQMSGTNVFVFGADGRITSVTGLANSA